MQTVRLAMTVAVIGVSATLGRSSANDDSAPELGALAYTARPAATTVQSDEGSRNAPVNAYALSREMRDGKLGIIGDSGSQGTHADDDCGSLNPYDCADQKLMQHDHAYSFSAGTQAWSLRNRLGFGEVVDASEDGDRWEDAYKQAQTIMADPDVRAVLIQLGSNDVCRGYGHDYTGDLDRIALYMDDTLTYLTEFLPQGGQIYIADIVNVVAMRNLMQWQWKHNHWYYFCQGVWDLSDDEDDVRDDMAVEVCDKELDLPKWLCENAVDINEIKQLLIDVMNDELLDGFLGSGPQNGQCGKILHSQSTDTDRAEAQQFNLDINTLIAEKAAQYAGRNGVEVWLSSGLYDTPIQITDVSKLDCFHPSRVGQERMSEVIWTNLRRVP